MDQQSNQAVTKSALTLYLIVEYTPQRYISAAVYDQRRRTFVFGSFADNEHYTNLESLLIQLNSKEAEQQFSVIVSIRTDINSEVRKITSKVADLKFKVDSANTGKFNGAELELALSNLLQKELAYYVKEMEDKKGMEALEKLLKNLSLEKDLTNKGQFILEILKLNKFMKLDQPVINALLIFPKDMDKKIIAGTNTIFEILNTCKSSIGTRCLKRWMRQPLQDEEELQARLDKVEYFIKDPVIRNLVHAEMKRLPDLDSLYYTFYKVEAGKKNNVEVNDLIKIYRTAKIIQDLLNGLVNKNLDSTPVGRIVEQIQKNTKILLGVCSMIEDNIIMEGRQNQFHVRPDAQQELTVISKEQKKVNTSIHDHIKQISQEIGVQVSKLPSSVHRWVLEADKKQSIDFIKEKDGFKYLTSKQNKITFTTDQMTGFCQTLIYLDDQYKEKEKEILRKMYKVVAGYYPIMEQLSNILSELDVLTTFASFINSAGGSDTPWTRPVFSSFIRGSNLHHPCVRTCVPNDCDISNQKTIILTGPNMGGKSTYIRTVGLAVYLAHIGCYVPAKKLETSIVDAIITRVGASDMQIKGISTFMSEMIESAAMLRSATSNSLVLIDELGRGTSTSEGFGIAWAICLQLHRNTNPFCLFATHFHQMTRMEDKVEGVKNMHTSCRFEQNNLILEYKVIEGRMDKSYGIEVMKMLKFPERMIQNAQSYLSLFENQPKMLQSQPQHSSQKPLTAEQNEALAIFIKMKVQIRNVTNDEEKRQIENKFKAQIKQVLGC